MSSRQDRGIKVITWDSDASDSGRSYMVNQVNDAVLGRMLIDDIAEQMGGSGEWAIAIASLDASNLNTWRKYAEEHAKEKYPDLKLVDTVVTKEDAETARQLVQSLINANPNLKGIVAFDSNSVPGAAEAIKRADKVGQIALVGNSTPQSMRPYIKEGVLQSFYLWNPQLLGELTVRVAHAMIEGKEIKAGTDLPGYGPIELHPDDPTTIIMSEPIRFTAENIDEYDFGI
ncbi:MAG: substrate-binding domain-containing protein [Planctomycetaceae bacterium]